jgi:hypothetical protein
VLASLSAGSSGERWRRRVEEAFDSGRRRLGKAARLMRRLRQ